MEIVLGHALIRMYGLSHFPMTHHGNDVEQTLIKTMEEDEMSLLVLKVPTTWARLMSQFCPQERIYLLAVNTDHCGDLWKHCVSCADASLRKMEAEIKIVGKTLASTHLAYKGFLPWLIGLACVLRMLTTKIVALPWKKVEMTFFAPTYLLSSEWCYVILAITNRCFSWVVDCF